MPEIMPLEPLGAEEKDRYAEMSAEFSGRASQQTEDEPQDENTKPTDGHEGIGAES